MFDVGFSELIVIALVGLIVIGPERLPKVVRTAGHLLGRLQRYVGDVKADINREMQLEDLRKLQAQVAEQVDDMERQVNKQMRTVEGELNQSMLAAAPGASPDAGAPVTEVALAVSAAPGVAASAPAPQTPPTAA